jgi:ATP-binding cassette subfamily B protein
MRILLRLLKSLDSYRWQVGGLLVCVVAVTTASLITPSLIRAAIDDGLAKRDSGVLASIALTIVGIAIVRALFNFGRRYLSEWLINRTGYDFRNALYDKIQHLPFSYHDQTQTGQLMSRCTEDVSSLSRFVGQGAVELLNVMLLSVGIVFLLFQQSITLTLVGMMPLVILVVLTIFFGRRVGRLFLRIDQALGDLSATLQENLTGAQVVRAFAREEYEKAKFANAHQKLYDARVNVLTTWGVFMPTTTILIMLSTVLMLWLGGQMAIAGTLTLGTLVAFNAYLILLALPIGELGWIINAVGEAIAGGQRIFEILDVAEEIASPPNAIELPGLEGRVAFDSVTFSYRGTSPSGDGERPALHNVSFEAKPNQVVALIGPTGSGKTSIVNLIPRFYDPTEGRVLLDDYDIKAVDLSRCARKSGSCCKVRSSFRCPSARILPMVEWTRRRMRLSWRQRRRVRTISFARFQTTTTRWWVSEASPCRVGSGSASRLRAHCC